MIKYELMGVETLESALKTKSRADFEKVRNKNLLQMRDRAVRSKSPSKGGTPVDSGELRLDARADTSRGLMGYTKDYAPHVEYGHRTRGGGYVPGQKYLGANVNIQNPIYRQDLVNEMRKK